MFHNIIFQIDIGITKEISFFIFIHHKVKQTKIIIKINHVVKMIAWEEFPNRLYNNCIAIQAML